MFARFALVGALFALANALLLAALVSGLGLHYLAASILSFFLLNFLSYVLNKTFTFRLARQVVAREVGRYYAVMAASLAANLLLMYMLVDLLSLHYLLASAVVMIALSMLNFLGHAAFSFRPTGKEHACAYDVLQVTAFFPEHGGGIEMVAGKIAKELATDGKSILWMSGSKNGIVSINSHPNIKLLPQKYIDPLESRTGLPMPIWMPRSLPTLWSAVSESKVIHLHDYLYLPCMAAMLIAKLQGKPVVLTQHIGELPIRNRLLRIVVSGLNRTVGRLMLSSAKQTVFIAQPVMDYFTQFVIFSKPALLIPNGVDHSLFHPGTERKINSKTRLLFVGRFVEKKGIHLLRYSLDIPGTQWAFVGWGPLSPSNWTGLPSDARVIERASPNQLAPLYRQADLLVLPSVGEGFPLVVQESLACGTPVLVDTKMAETCPNRNPECVFSVDATGHDADVRVRNLIIELITNREALHHARSAARRLATQWSWDACARQYHEIYCELTNDLASL